MLLTQNIRDIVICILAFLIWGWSGVAISFIALFALNIGELYLHSKTMEADHEYD